MKIPGHPAGPKRWPACTSTECVKPPTVTSHRDSAEVVCAYPRRPREIHQASVVSSNSAPAAMSQPETLPQPAAAPSMPPAAARTPLPIARSLTSAPLCSECKEPCDIPGAFATAGFGGPCVLATDSLHYRRDPQLGRCLYLLTWYVHQRCLRAGGFAARDEGHTARLGRPARKLTEVT